MKNIFPKIISALLLLTVFTMSVAAESPRSADENKNVRLKWKSGTINIALSPSLSKIEPNIKLGSDILGAVRRSLATWEKVTNIQFNEVPSDKLSVSPAGNAGDGVSLITIAPTDENIQLFGEDAEVSAKTRVFYNRKGFITEADIVLNPYVQFSTDGNVGMFDLEATLTHEIGHLLGLEHSNFCGSTMHTHQAKNGIYNLPQIASRTLSDSDIANIRALYGSPFDAENCCGSVKGKLSLPATVAASGFQVWLENLVTGKVQAGTVTNADGSFSLEGLTAGKYKIFAQDSGEKQKNRKKIYAGDELGEISVENGKVTAFDKEISFKERTFSLKYVGFNGQISNVAVPVNGGKSFLIYLGGEKLNPKDFQVFINSPNFKVTPKSITAQDFGDEISVLTFETIARNNLPLGEYTITVQKSNGEKAFIVGGLTSDVVVNPWNTAITNFND